MNVEIPRVEKFRADANALLESLNLRGIERPTRPVSGHSTSLLVPCVGDGDRPFLLKYFLPPEESRFYPAGVRIADYARREAAFYRFLDSVDPDRQLLPAPRTILIDPGDPPGWILLEWIEPAVGPTEEVLGSEHVFEILRRLQDIPKDMLLGRRDFPLNHWDTVSYRDRVRLMYESVFDTVGDERWRRAQDFFVEAIRWTETRPSTLVHGDFTEANVMIDQDGSPFLVDFERIGIGNVDHDFAWLWIHSSREQTFKRSLLERHFGQRFGSERIKSEWGIRAALVYLALRRIHFAAMRAKSEQVGQAVLTEQCTGSIALLDAALRGGADLFPV